MPLVEEKERYVPGARSTLIDTLQDYLANQLMSKITLHAAETVELKGQHQKDLNSKQYQHLFSLRQLKRVLRLNKPAVKIKKRGA